MEKARKIRAFVYSFFILSACFLIQIACLASDTLLSEVEIKNSNGTYDIILQVNKSTNINRKVTADDKMILTLSSTSGVENTPVIFDGDNKIDNIVIQNKKDNVEILIQGNKINNSNIFFKETNTGLLKQAYSLSDRKLLNTSLINVLDAKFCIIFVISFSFLLLLFSFVKPQKKQSIERINNIKTREPKVQTKMNSTIRVHSLSQRNANAPYIHYSLAAKGHSIPDDLKTSGTTFKEEKIKKYG